MHVDTHHTYTHTLSDYTQWFGGIVQDVCALPLHSLPTYSLLLSLMCDKSLHVSLIYEASE